MTASSSVTGPRDGGLVKPGWRSSLGAILTQAVAWSNVEKALKNLKRED